MKILYGVVGEGMGHAMRSRVVLAHLLGEGHEVHVMASSRAADYLSARFEDVHRIHGLHIITEENRVRKGKTLWSNVLRGTAALPGQIEAYFDLLDEFEPEAVISDFESWTYLYGQAHGIPVFSVDNMQIINRCVHPAEVIEGRRAEFELVKAFIKTKLPFCEHYFITTFFYPGVAKERTSLFPPILRPEILAATPSRGKHLVVYQTAEGHSALADALARSGRECRIYGMRRSIAADEWDGNLCYRPFDEKRFIEDLASAYAFVGGGGFTAMGEAVYLRKPMLSVALEGQFEQTMNARYLELEGYGMCAEQVDDSTIERFLERVPACRKRLSRYRQNGNVLILRALDEHLDRVAAGLY